MRAPRRSSATWRPTAATCCSGRAARTSTTPRRRATSASPAAAAPPSTGSTATTRSSAPASTASPRTRPTCASRWRRWRPSSTSPGRAASAPIPFAEFHRLPGDTPHLDTHLGPDELITAVDLPPKGFAEHHAYLKIRDRHSYAFALVSVAAALEMDGDTIARAAHRAGRGGAQALARPRRRGAPGRRKATAEHFREARRAILRDARGFEHNTFKIELARRPIVRALTEAAERGRDRRMTHRRTSASRSTASTAAPR